jgi:archaellum component FlaF (FlaF/FlaG flagellin family)
MTGSGGVINNNGTFALGNSSNNISFNGSIMTLNGDVVATGNLVANAATVPTGAELTADITPVQLSLLDLDNVALWTTIFSATIPTNGAALYTSLNSWIAVRNTGSVLLGRALIGIIINGVLVERFAAFETNNTFFIPRQILLSNFESTTSANPVVRIAAASLSGVEARILFPGSTITLGNSGTNFFSIGAKR